MTNAFRFQIILPLLAMLLIAALASVVHADTIPLTVDNCSFTASSKTYDATTDASINVAGCNSPTLNAAGIVPGDDVSVILGSISGSFDTKDVGNGKTVTLSGLTLIGADAANYSILEPTATANITPATLNGSFHAGDKVYDGTAAASITGEFINPLGTDDVSLSGGTATFADKNAGTNKDVTLLNAGLVGADVGNYTLGTISGTQATITPKPLTVTASGVDKVFDGTTNATVTLATDAYGSDDVTAGYTSASLADENVANGIAVAVSGISIGGTDAVNYTLQNTTDSTSADITAATSSVNFTCTTESYDSTPKETCSATVIGAGGLSQNISGDIQYTTNTNAGTAGASVSYAGDLNHSATATSTTFTITPIALVVTANDSSKFMNAVDPSFTYTHGSLVGSDTEAVFTGALARDAGETPGTYLIRQGTLSAGPNYTIAFTNGTFTLKNVANGFGGGGGGGGSGPVLALPNNGGAAPGVTVTAPLVSVVPQVLGASTYNFDTDLKVGSSSLAVTELQKLLIAEGFLSGEPTGYFGGLTKAAVVHYQKAHGISPASGKVGPLTRAELNKGSTPTATDEQKTVLIQTLQDQLKALMAQLAAILAGKTASSTATH